ncbi:MAG: citrate transporter, partial [Clostridia bacterium]|nr:citrate transporter [Clostridia bacterium]
LITVIVILIFDRKVILKIDYSLLFTFIFLFIFIGNLGEIKVISDFLKSIVIGNEVLVGIISSQVFSNVPATILLSKFTENVKDLLIGVNLGGLGTLIASMASLISFKFVAKEKVSTGKYILTFTVVNIVFLIFNLGLWLIIR